jgi:hypothetical protein
VFDLTFQGLENASVLNKLGSVEPRLSLLRCFLLNRASHCCDVFC